MITRQYAYFCSMSLTPLLAIVAPCYNEELILSDRIRDLRTKMQDLKARNLVADNSFILVVDDGSTDRSFSIMEDLVAEDLKLVRLSRNVGHQKALLAGMHWVTGKCNCMISIDVDLQDDIAAMDEMLLAYAEGSAIVYGVRRSRNTDPWFKKTSALMFYRITRIMGVQIVPNHGDYRLLSNDVLREFSNYRESNLFLRGIFPRMGFASAKVYYDRQSRSAGESKYSLMRMLSLAIDGITSFSNRPLKWITAIGLLIFVGSIALSGWVFWAFITGKSIPGWASIALPVYFIGGVQLLCLGVIGEYLSKIFLETKKRPPYHIEKVVETD